MSYILIGLAIVIFAFVILIHGVWRPSKGYEQMNAQDESRYGPQ